MELSGLIYIYIYIYIEGYGILISGDKRVKRGMMFRVHLKEMSIKAYWSEGEKIHKTAQKNTLPNFKPD